MGLLYPFPVSEEETDHVIQNEKKEIILKSYGLPYIFWFYLLGVLLIISVMGIAIYNPITTLMKTGHDIDLFISWGVIITIALVPFGFLTLFFTEDRIIKLKEKITLERRCFGIPLKKKTETLDLEKGFWINHYANTPNIARMENDNQMKGYQNKGYFELFAQNQNGQKFMVDRHSRKADLVKLIDLLNKY